MGKKNQEAQKKRTYTEDDINKLLSTSAELIRERRLRHLRDMMSKVFVLYGVVLALVGVYFVVNTILTHSDDDPYANIKDPANVVVGYTHDEHGQDIKRVYDDSDFNPSIEELALSSLNRSIKTSLLELKIPSEEVERMFTNHSYMNDKREAEESLDILRFRIRVKSGEVIELAILRHYNQIICTRSSESVAIPVCDIICVRKAISSAAYKEDVQMDFARKGVSLLPEGYIARSQYECMTDSEARQFFTIIANAAQATLFDWENVAKISTFGIWNKYHPIQSILLTLIAWALVLFVRKKILK